MRYPTLYTKENDRQMIDIFKGYNHNLRIGNGEFFDMKNMTSDYYPILSPRKKRGMYLQGATYNGLIAKDSLCHVEDEYFVINQYRVNMGLTDSPKQLISMGAYVIIMPDKKWINTKCWLDDDTFDEENGWGLIESELVTDQPTTFTLCKLDGTDYGVVPAGEDVPDSPKNMELWVDTSSRPHTLKQWSDASGMWVSIATTYIKICHEGIDKKFEVYDGITISGLKDQELLDGAGNAIKNTKDLVALEGAAVVWGKGDGYIIVVGMMDETITVSNQIAISRTMPEMDFVIESENRLWGCHYGVAANGKVVNEIYASKLGDFKNWNCFMGLATDSYSASCGTDGVFTGAIHFKGNPIFFKENCVHKVYGNYPANFQIQATDCRGVQRDCGRSLAIVNEVLYYKARSGVCAYDGSLPTEVSHVFGNETYSKAVGGAHGNKYYISMTDSEDQANLFVYDTAKGLWHKEDDLEVDFFCSCRGEMFAISNNKIVTMFGTGTADPNVVEWMVQTGEIGISSPDMKYISRLTVRMQLDIGAEVRIYVQYDFCDTWEQVFSMCGTNLRSFSLPIRPKRCDFMRLRIEGAGEAKIYSITKTIEQGSELS